MANANTLGAYDFFGGDNHLSDYSDVNEKRSYLQGRIVGDALAMIQGGSEVSGGNATAAAGLASVAGALVVTTSGLLISLHGVGVGGVATADMTKTLIQIYHLASTVKGSSPLVKEGDTGPFKTLKKGPKAVPDLEVHHLIEKRFRELFGEKARNMISKVLNKKDHQEFTNEWRKLIKYGEGTDNASRESVIKAAKEIYSEHPDILKALEPYFKKK